LQILYFAIALLIGLSVHEASHAFTADQLGDPTPRALGRLTLNPIAHLDALGAFVLVISSLFGYGIGWGKPVPVNPRNLSRGILKNLANGPLVGMALVAIAGPISNLLLAVIGVQVLVHTPLPLRFVESFILINVILAIFNMIPIPPLDGYRVLVGLMPGKSGYTLARLEPYGQGILLLMIFLLPQVWTGILAAASRPIFRLIGLT
jgi:Zn-dependent protease